MVAINFSDRFAPLVKAGTKRQTIRRTARCKAGDRLQLYTGQRTPACRKLVDPDPVCELIDYVAIRPGYLTLGNVNHHPRDIDDFARADGFRDYADMVAWFEETYGSPYFTGVVIRWATPATPAPCDERREAAETEGLRPKATSAVAREAGEAPERTSHDL